MPDPMDFPVVDGDEFDQGHLECPVDGCWWEGEKMWSGSTTVGDLLAEASNHAATHVA